LLTLPESVQADLAAGRLSAGHARALLALESDPARVALAREVVQRRLSVRDTETAVGRAKAHAVPASPEDPDVRRLSADLSRALGTKVAIHCSGEGGRVEIAFYSDDDLARLCDLLLAAGRSGASRAARA
jgi:ParB family chromosome partitioning protein